MIGLHEHDGLTELRRELRCDPQVFDGLRADLYRRAVSDEEALARVPQEFRAAVEEAICFHPLRLEERFDSQVDGATRLVFRTKKDELIESVVLRIATGRTSICLSTQVGCAADCRFCATGKMGLSRNLTTGEILDQIVQVNQLLKSEERSVRNVVFMGMGEPFHNTGALFDALDVLFASGGLAMHPKRVLISTVGVPEGMRRAIERYPEIGIALSLHSARSDVRETLIPLAARHTLDELQEMIRAINAVQDAPFMIEYLMLAGVNDQGDDAAALIEFVQGLNVHINLIPYNAIAGAPELTGTDRSTIARFSERLKTSGLTTTTRYSLGADIAAACGQLVQEHNQRIVRISGNSAHG